jgi:hypothetical protein
MVAIEANVPYMSVRTLVWLAAAAAQVVWLGMKGNVETRQPKALSYMIATITGLFAARDLWLVIAFSSGMVAALYLGEFLYATAWAAFLVRSLPLHTLSCA